MLEKKFHFIGIGGIGMSSLAYLLLKNKFSVSGSDLTHHSIIENLIKEGAVIYRGHSPNNIPSNATVVYSSDIKADNCEYTTALKMNCHLLHRSDLLAELVKEKKSLAVAGTHGKTTTTSLLATVLVEAGLDPSFAIGGILSAFQCNARYSKGESFVFEADESDRTFLKYHPYGAIITNINDDHLNNFDNSMPVLIDSFRQFMAQLQSPHLVWCGDDPHLTQLHAAGTSYGFHTDSDWIISSMRQEGYRVFFDLTHSNKCYEHIELNLMGKHNTSNAAAVFVLCHNLGIPEEKIRHSFKTFKGVLRRCEMKGRYKDTIFLDDYAHHPTEIKTTLQGIRHAIGNQRLIAIFQPHRYSRTLHCLGQYGSVFESANEVLITDIYSAGENNFSNLSHSQIQQEIQERNIPCQYVPRSILSHYLREFIIPNDVVITLGAGDITKLWNEVHSSTLDLLHN